MSNHKPTHTTPNNNMIITPINRLQIPLLHRRANARESQRERRNPRNHSHVEKSAELKVEEGEPAAKASAKHSTAILYAPSPS
jgi:hypothetical protein